MTTPQNEVILLIDDGEKLGNRLDVVLLFMELLT